MSDKTAISTKALSSSFKIEKSRRKIFNLHSNNIREAEDFKVMSHEEYDKYGKLRTNKYVEYIIIGKNRRWEDFMPVKDFKKLNPKIKVKGLN